MNRWENKVAVVTGASSGIGASCVKALLKSGLITVGLARRQNRINEIKAGLPENLQSRLHALTCDVSQENNVKEAFKWINENLGGTDILINNAGILKSGELIGTDNTKEIVDTVNTNILGVYYCTKEAFTSMKERKSDGHVVLLNSTAGHTAYFGDDPSYNIYCGTKHAITAMTETYRQEFQRNGTNVKVTVILPKTIYLQNLSK